MHHLFQFLDIHFLDVVRALRPFARFEALHATYDLGDSCNNTNAPAIGIRVLK